MSTLNDVSTSRSTWVIVFSFETIVSDEILPRLTFFDFTFRTSELLGCRGSLKSEIKSRFVDDFRDFSVFIFSLFVGMDPSLGMDLE